MRKPDKRPVRWLLFVKNAGEQSEYVGHFSIAPALKESDPKVLREFKTLKNVLAMSGFSTQVKQPIVAWTGLIESNTVAVDSKAPSEVLSHLRITARRIRLMRIFVGLYDWLRCISSSSCVRHPQRIRTTNAGSSGAVGTLGRATLLALEAITEKYVQDPAEDAVPVAKS